MSRRRSENDWSTSLDDQQSDGGDSASSSGLNVGVLLVVFAGVAVFVVMGAGAFFWVMTGSAESRSTASKKMQEIVEEKSAVPVDAFLRESRRMIREQPDSRRLARSRRFP